MAKDKSEASVSFAQDLFNFGVYKRNQGRLVRQVTFSSIAIGLLLAAWNLWGPFQGLADKLPGGDYGVAGLLGVLLVIGIWFAYRLVNWPKFAEFLISVEAELNKVSWPSSQELIRSSLVVMFLMFFLAFVLFGFDLFWQILFKATGIIRQAPPS